MQKLQSEIGNGSKISYSTSQSVPPRKGQDYMKTAVQSAYGVSDRDHTPKKKMQVPLTEQMKNSVLTQAYLFPEIPAQKKNPNE